MNKTIEDGTILLSEVVNMVKDEVVNPNVQVVVCVPFPYLSTFGKLIDTDKVALGAQNCYPKASGAFTGEVSVPMLASVGVKYVIIGHSERREIFHEDNQLIAQKVQACVEEQLPFILCCGETQAVRKENLHLTFIQAQIQAALERFSPDHLHLLAIAYEPIWAIGSGLSADQNQIIEMHGAIRTFLIEQFGEGGKDIPILYGGSVSTVNAAQIFSCPEVGGALVGGASLDPQVFNQLWEQL
mgnify:CR=1 FL=1